MKKERMLRIDAVWVVNLARRTDRWTEFCSRFPYRMDLVTRVEAIDGHALTPPYPPKVSGLSPGEIGCIMSHVDVWKRILESESEDNTHLVFEDDAHFDRDFCSKWETIYAPSLPPADTFDIAYIGGRSYPHHRESISKAGSWYVTSEDRTTHAYIITRRGARHLLRLYESQKVMHRPLDHMLMDWSRNGKLTSPALCSAELICWSPLDYKSDIQRRR